MQSIRSTRRIHRYTTRTVGFMADAQLKLTAEMRGR